MRPSPLLNTHTRQSQIQSFSPRLQHAVRLLNMSSLEYAEALVEESAENPFLEVDASALSGWNDAQADDRMGWTTARAARLQSDMEMDAAAGLTRPLGLREHLHAQLGVLRLPQDEFACATAIIDCLDDDGYLRIALDELVAWGNSVCDLVIAEGAVDEEADASNLATHAAHEALWRIALRRVQSLDPCGVAARSLCECLELQAQQIPQAEGRTLVLTILRDHLALLGRGDMKQLARHTGASPAAVSQAARAIRQMQPKPGAAFAQDVAPYVVPEVLVRRRGKGWAASLNEAAFPRLKLDAALADWAQRQRAAASAPARELLERAQWTVHNLRQRSTTIHAVASEIVARQALFFEHGAYALKPLEMRDVAQKLGLHPSTVSRVVHHKFMATPLGTFELRHFFARGTAAGDAPNCAPMALQALLRAIVEAEPPQRPHSDVQLTRLLAQQGFALARRTVTKYRQALRIESVEKRRLSACG